MTGRVSGAESALREQDVAASRRQDENVTRSDTGTYAWYALSPNAVLDALRSCRDSQSEFSAWPDETPLFVVFPLQKSLDP